MRRVVAGLAVFVVALASCSTDPTTSAEYEELDLAYGQLEQELAAANANIDQLAARNTQLEAELDQASDGSRYDKVVANQEAVAEIIADPAAFGTQDEVLDLLMTYVVPGAVMDDVAFGAVEMRSAWRNTIFGVGANIETWTKWTAEDGSLAGSLWVWKGTAANGEQFELVGVNTDLYDEDGLVTYSLVEWPYDNAYVTQAFRTGN